MPTYYHLRRGLSRPTCAEMTEYYRLGVDGLLTCVSVYADGLAYTSPAHASTVPAQAVRSTAKAFTAALALADKRVADKKAALAAEKAAKKLLAGKKRPDALDLAILDLLEEEAAPVAAGTPPTAKAATGKALSPEEEERRERLWKESAESLLAYMSPEGQQRALAAWRTQGLPVPALPTPKPAPALVAVAGTPPAAGGLLDDITVLDLEFNGKHILQLGAVRYQRLKPVATLNTLVYFDGELNPFVRQLTNLNPFHLRQAPKEKAVLRDFFAFIGSSLLVCHNIGADRTVLEAARTRCGATAPLPNAWLCTMKLARKRRPKQPAGLGDLCQHFGIPTQGAHDALCDAQMAFQVLKCFHQQQPVTVAELAHGGPVATPTLFAAAA